MRLLILIATAFVLASPAQAQEYSWADYPIEGGCTIALRRPLSEDVTVSWTQTCVSGQPISGQGQLRFAYQSTGRTVVLEADFIAGVPHGAATMTGYTPAGDAYHTERAEFDMGCDLRGSGCTPHAPR